MQRVSLPASEPSPGPQWSTGTNSGWSPGGPTTFPTCRRHSGRATPRRTSGNGTESAPARPPASRPRPSRPLSDKALLPTSASRVRGPGDRPHARSPGCQSCYILLGSKRADWPSRPWSLRWSTVGAGHPRVLGVQGAWPGILSHPHAVPSNPLQVGDQGVRVSAWSFVVLPWGAWSGPVSEVPGADADRPDEEAAESQGRGHTYAARHSHHHPVVEADAGPAAELRGAGVQALHSHDC